MVGELIGKRNMDMLADASTASSETVYLTLEGKKVGREDARKVMTIYRDNNAKAIRYVLTFL
ncbi:MAG: hypothetical protein P4N59_16885 [Negativicutes bacterium]|nr:hypothetical protein [Negativicutes bacterium]